MDEEKEVNNDFCVWVDWEHQIISFREAEGFEKITHKSRDEMFFRVIRLVDKNFAIQ